MKIVLPLKSLRTTDEVKSRVLHMGCIIFVNVCIEAINQSIWALGQCLVNRDKQHPDNHENNPKVTHFEL